MRWIAHQEEHRKISAAGATNLGEPFNGNQMDSPPREASCRNKMRACRGTRLVLCRHERCYLRQNRAKRQRAALKDVSISPFP